MTTSNQDEYYENGCESTRHYHDSDVPVLLLVIIAIVLVAIVCVCRVGIYFSMSIVEIIIV